MRFSFTISLILIYSSCFAQIITEVRPIKGNVAEIKQIDYSNGLFKSGWKNYYYFDTNNNLIRQVNYFKKELRKDESYEYEVKEGLKKIKNIYTDKENF